LITPGVGVGVVVGVGVDVDVGVGVFVGVDVAVAVGVTVGSVQTKPVPKQLVNATTTPTILDIANTERPRMGVRRLLRQPLGTGGSLSIVVPGRFSPVTSPDCSL
jgi:hypothetical protein